MNVLTVPFAGFYESSHSYEIDRAIDDQFQDDSGEPLGGAFANSWEHFDYRHIQEKYAADYVECLANESQISLSYESMTSPREYNFETDRLFAYVSRGDINHMAANVRLETLERVVNERFTSRSGFISHYSNRLKDWPESLEGWDHNQLGTLLIAYLDDMGIDLSQNGQLDMMEPHLYDALWVWADEARIPSPKLDRLERVYMYLRERWERRWRK